MATKTASKTATSKHAASTSAKSKHAKATTGSAKHNAGKKPGSTKATKHAPAKKESLQAQVAALVKADVQKQVAADVKKELTTLAGKAKAAKKKRGAPSALDEIACCAAEALAASFRLAGGRVDPDDVLALYWLTAASAEAGETILATLEAAQEHGLAGAHPVFESCEPRDGAIAGVTIPAGPHTVLLDGSGFWTWGERHLGALPEIEESWVISWQ
jgi:hypothetical protein